MQQTNSSVSNLSKTPFTRFGKIKSFLKKHWKRILIVLIIIVVFVRIGEQFAPKDTVALTPSPVVVIPFSIGQGGGTALNGSCTVQPITNVNVVAEVGGSVVSVLKTDGDQVEEGEIIFEVENTSERVSLADANAALQSAQFALDDLLNDNDSSRSTSLLSQTEEQQETLIATARNNYFNTDLRAYPEDNPGNARGGAPIISGNYQCGEEGEYLIDIYRSGSSSGASFSYTGLESGVQTVTTNGFSAPLGKCGLEIEFPEDFSKNEEWIIPVPNTRSLQSVASRNAYENAIESKSITLNQIAASPQQIQQERNSVEQARLRYQLALEQLNKKIVRATASGILTGFDIDEGQFVNSNQSVGQIKTVDQLELVTFVDAQEGRFIDVGSSAQVYGAETTVLNIAGAVDSVTRKLKVTITPPEGIDLTEGTQVSCVIDRETDAVTTKDGGIIVPLSAISVVGVDPYLFKITDSGKAQGLSIVTGAVLGDSVVVYGVEDSIIVASDARGIRDGDVIEIQ